MKRVLWLNTNNTPQGVTDKLFLIYQRCEHLQMALSTHVTVTKLIYSPKTTNSYPLNPLIFTPSRSQKTLRNIPTVWSRNKNGFFFLPPFLSMFQRCENIFVTLCHYQVSHETTSVKSTPLNLPTGWIFISHQSELRAGTKIFTHNSKSDIFTSCISSRFGGKSAAHLQPSFLQVFDSTGGAFN